jgi:hypothetical protein
VPRHVIEAAVHIRPLARPARPVVSDTGCLVTCGRTDRRGWIWVGAVTRLARSLAPLCAALTSATRSIGPPFAGSLRLPASSECTELANTRSLAVAGAEPFIRVGTSIQTTAASPGASANLRRQAWRARWRYKPGCAQRPKATGRPPRRESLEGAAPKRRSLRRWAMAIVRQLAGQQTGDVRQPASRLEASQAIELGCRRLARGRCYPPKSSH